MEASYWSPTDMEFQPQIAISNHSNLQNSGEIVDPWASNTQQSAIPHLAQPFNMESSGSYTSSLSSALTAHYQSNPPYQYAHFSTNHLDNTYAYDTQQSEQLPGPAMALSHNSHNRPNPTLPTDLPSHFPHLTDGSRVGLSEPWSPQGMRDMEAFEELCNSTNHLIRMKPRGQKKIAKPSEAMLTSPLTRIGEPSTINSQSFLTIQTGKTGCSSQVAVSHTMGNQTDGDVAKPEYNHDSLVSYIPPEPQHPDLVTSTDYSPTVAYSTASAQHLNDLSSVTGSNSSSPLSETAAFSPAVTGSMSPPLPSMTVPSQSSTPASPTTTRPAVRHATILPAPSNRSDSTLTLDAGVNVRQKRSYKAFVLGHDSEASSPNQSGHQSPTKPSAVDSNDIKSPVLNGPALTSSSGAADSAKSTRSRRNASSNNSGTAATTPDPPNTLEHKLTETYNVLPAELDSYFQQSEQGCIGGRKAWMCPKCKKAVRKQDRASHKLGHEGKKRFDCQCGKQFGRPQDADRHMREQAPCGRCPGKMGRYGKDGLCSACVTEIEQGGAT